MFSAEKKVIQFDDEGNDFVVADTTAGVADKGVYTVLMPMVVRRIGFVVSTTIVNPTIAAVKSVDYRPNFGSETDRAEIDTLTLPTGTAAGKIVYVDVNYRVLPGPQLVAEHKTAGTGAGAAGAGRIVVVADYSNETAANCAQVLASV